MPASPGQVARVRAFNRFHTRLVGALDRRILDSPHSLTESRVLFEIAHGRDLTAAARAKGLRLDWSTKRCGSRRAPDIAR